MTHPINRCFSRCAIAGWLIALSTFSLSAGWRQAAGGESSDATLASDFAEQIQPLMAKYCSGCHAGEAPEGRLDLSRYDQVDRVLRDRRAWQRIDQRLRDGEMPPEGEERPTSDELERWRNWMRRAAEARDHLYPARPGRVTMRRLNRAEYNNTIHDLLGIDFRPARDFPSDDVGYGFDNIGDVLSLPTLLMEKYVAAAQQALSQAVETSPRYAELLQMNAQAFEQQASGGVVNETSRILTTDGQIRTQLESAGDGLYRLMIRAYGDQAGGEPARMALKIDDRMAAEWNVEAVVDAPGVYSVEVNSTPGPHQLAIAFTNDYFDPTMADPNRRDRNLVVQSLDISRRIPLAEYPESHRRIFPREVAPSERAAAAREFIGAFATRAFRRPVASEEVERLMRLYAVAEQAGDSFEGCVKLALEAVLVSPHFLFRIEADPPDMPADGVRELNDFELASRLSYFLWSSMPDEELFALARANRLREPSQLEAQVKRMMRDAKARALVDNFAGQWLQLRTLDRVTPDKNLFKEFDQRLRESMRTETEMFFESVLKEDRPILDFLDAKYTFINDRLAKHYGIEGPKGKQFERVELDGVQRGGILTHASVLTVTSNPTRTSPVKRGKFVLESILGTPPPPPPSEVPELQDNAEAQLTGSLRQRMEQHRENPSCALCHKQMDPIGFGLENYNAIGGWRTMDGQFPVEAGGEFPGGKPFTTPAELMAILRERKEQFCRCLTEKLLIYAIGRGLEEDDARVIDELAAAAQRGEYRFSSLLLAIVQSEPFRLTIHR